MTVRTARKVVIVLCLLLAVMMFSRAVSDSQPKRVTSDDMPYIVLFLCGMIGVAVFSYFYLRCPKCGRHLSRSEINDLRCLSCGEDFKHRHSEK